MTVEVKKEISEVNLSTDLTRRGLNELTVDLNALGEIGDRLLEIVRNLASAVDNIDNAVGLLTLAATINQDGSFKVSLNLSAESAECFLVGGPNKPITELSLGKRAQNVLEALNVTTTYELTQLTGYDLAAFKGCGTTTINEIREALERFNLKLRGD